jgi:hypothetical protein
MQHASTVIAVSGLKDSFTVLNTAHRQAGSTLYVAGAKQIVARTLLSYDSL